MIFGKAVVVVAVRSYWGRDATSISHTWALIKSTPAGLSSFLTFCSGLAVGEGASLLSTLKEKLNPGEGGENLKSVFGRAGIVDRGDLLDTGGAGDGGVDALSAWKLKRNLLGSFGTELAFNPPNEDREAVELELWAGAEDPLGFGASLEVAFSCAFSAPCISTSTTSSMVISGTGDGEGAFFGTDDGRPCPLTEGLDRLADF